MQKNTMSSTLYRTPFSAAYWKQAAADAKNIRMLTLAALLIALRLILSNFYIPVAQGMNIYFGYLLNALGAAIYGPIMGIITGFVVDILGFILTPSQYGFFFGYTITAMAGSFLYALFLYRTRVSIVRIALAKAAVNVFVNILMGALWSSMLFSKGYLYYLARSVVKNVVMLPVEILLLYLFFQVMLPILSQMRLAPAQPAKRIPFI
ncbi:MAG: folate family ECF transporter S component [Negativibacillus sp.]